MDCPIGISILFCSISKGSRILYSHSIDRHHETLALAALQAAPPFHSRYTHTAGDLTFAFLFDGDGPTTYFAIAEPSAAVMPFLVLMRDGFRSTLNKEIVNSASSPSMKMAEAPLLSGGGGDEEARGEMWIEMGVEPAGPMPLPVPVQMPAPLQKSLSAGAWMRESGRRRLWWRHVKILVAVDVLLCLVLFGIWLAVCGGFQCVA